MLWGFLPFCGSCTQQARRQSLDEWSMQHLGSQNDDRGAGFGYNDILADADGCLIAQAMKASNSSGSLAEAMRTVFAFSPINRIRKFYEDRFGGNADNVVSTFSQLVNGIIGGAPDFSEINKEVIKQAAHANTLPNKDQADALAHVYASFMQQPVYR